MLRHLPDQKVNVASTPRTETPLTPTVHCKTMTNDRPRDIDDDALCAYRRALRSAVAAVIDRLIREKKLSQAVVSGMADLNRNTLRSVLTSGYHQTVPCPKLDTISDILYALRVTPAEFAARLAWELEKRRPTPASRPETHEFEIAIGAHVLRGELRHLKQPEKYQ